MKNPFVRGYSVEELNNLRILGKVPVFQSLTKRELREFIPSIYERRFRQNEAVYFSGDPAMALYIIKSGTVELHLVRDDEFDPIQTLKAGESFGEGCMIPDSKRLFSAIVHSETAVLDVLPSSDLLDTIEKNDSIRAKIYLSLAKLMYEREAHMLSVSRKKSGFFELSEAYKR